MAASCSISDKFDVDLHDKPGGLDLNEVGNEFVGNKEMRMRLFGKVF